MHNEWNTENEQENQFNYMRSQYEWEENEVNDRV